uniref:Uncharacterized protein n=1 Tax=Arundo donax TaxID=35708 RepID=A0A0A9HG91_ARUDO
MALVLSVLTNHGYEQQLGAMGEIVSVSVEMFCILSGDMCTFAKRRLVAELGNKHVVSVSVEVVLLYEWNSNSFLWR